MKALEVRDIIKLSINDICVNPENPRHDGAEADTIHKPRRTFRKVNS